MLDKQSEMNTFTTQTLNGSASPLTRVASRLSVYPVSKINATTRVCHLMVETKRYMFRFLPDGKERTQTLFQQLVGH